MLNTHPCWMHTGVLMRAGSQAGQAVQHQGGSDRGTGGRGTGAVGARSARKMQAAKQAQQEQRWREQLPRRMVGGAATFIVCGLLHELAYWWVHFCASPAAHPSLSNACA